MPVVQPHSSAHPPTSTRHLARVSQADVLTLYGLYKQATCGDINAPRPSWSPLDPLGRARLKWDAWNARRGDPAEQCMMDYVDLLGKAVPDWGSGDAWGKGNKPSASSGGGGPMGPVASTLAGGMDRLHAEEDEDRRRRGEEGPSDHPAGVTEGPERDVWAALRGGDTATALQAWGRVEANARPQAARRRDASGLTLLHLAADAGGPGAADLARALAVSGADVNAADGVGLTPLHCCCAAARADHADIAKALVAAGADPTACDDDGEEAGAKAPEAWEAFMPRRGIRDAS